MHAQTYIGTFSLFKWASLAQRDSRTLYAFPRETVYFIRLRLTGSLIIHFSSRARLLRSNTHTYCVSLKAGITLQFNDIFLPTYLDAHVGKLSIKGMAVQGESLRGSSVNRPQMVTRPRRRCRHIAAKLSVNVSTISIHSPCIIQVWQMHPRFALFYNKYP